MIKTKTNININYFEFDKEGKYIVMILNGKEIQKRSIKSTEINDISSKIILDGYKVIMALAIN